TLSGWVSASVPARTAYLVCTSTCGGARGKKRTFAQNGGWTAVADGPVPLDGLS
ncbi:unnamed protein product, partial [Ectocarpus sp. 4 AP-2014]